MRIVRPMLLALVASAVLSYNVHAQAPPPILQEPQTIPCGRAERRGRRVMLRKTFRR
jgi:hypothetical protein